MRKLVFVALFGVVLYGMANSLPGPRPLRQITYISFPDKPWTEADSYPKRTVRCLGLRDWREKRFYWKYENQIRSSGNAKLQRQFHNCVWYGEPRPRFLSLFSVDSRCLLCPTKNPMQCRAAKAETGKSRT